MTKSDAQARWVNVPLEVARGHPLYGIGGWMTLVALGVVISPLRIGFEAVATYTSIDLASLPPLLSTVVAVEALVNAAFALWGGANIFLLFTKHWAFPSSFIAFVASNLAFITGEVVVVKQVMDSIGQPMSWGEAFDPSTAREVGRGVVSAAIWIPYMLVSKRVNVTYRNRIRPDDPAIQKATAEVF